MRLKQGARDRSEFSKQSIGRGVSTPRSIEFSFFVPMTSLGKRARRLRTTSQNVRESWCSCSESEAAPRWLADKRVAIACYDVRNRGHAPETAPRRGRLWASPRISGSVALIASTTRSRIFGWRDDSSVTHLFEMRAVTYFVTIRESFFFLGRSVPFQARNSVNSHQINRFLKGKKCESFNMDGDPKI